MKYTIVNSFFGLLQNKLLTLTVLILTLVKVVESATECLKRKYYINVFGQPLNATVKCQMYFQWTVNDQCCYGPYDRFENNPYCCYSETYKLLVAVGFICLVLLGSSCFIFICWVYNLPHHILYAITCHKFNLNNFLLNNKNGPYVDPSFYSGQPFWARGGEMQPYPLRPMPPRIFYPAPPANMKFRWDMAHGQMPLFVLASRQFTRNPYSARPNERHLQHQLPPFLSTAMSASNPGSRRSSLTNYHDRDPHHQNKMMPTFGYAVNIDEMEAAAELLEALKNMEEKGDKSYSSERWNVADNVAAITVVPEYPVVNVKPEDFQSSRPSTDGRLVTKSSNTTTISSNYFTSNLGMPMPVYIAPAIHSSNSSTAHHHSHNNHHHFGRSDSLPGTLGGNNVMESIPEDDTTDAESEDRENRSNKITRELMDRRLSTAAAIESSTATCTTIVPFIPSLPGHIPDKPEGNSESTRTSRRNSDAL